MGLYPNITYLNILHSHIIAVSSQPKVMNEMKPDQITIT